MRKQFSSIVIYLLLIFSFGKSFAQCGSLLAPSVTDITKCMDYENTVLTATAKGSGKLQWFDGNNIATATKLGSPSTSYTSTVTTDGNYKYYVAEFDNVNQCYGPVSLVKLTIYSKPQKPIIEEPYIISCANTNIIKPLTIQVAYSDNINSFQWYNFKTKQPITYQDGNISGFYNETFTLKSVYPNSYQRFYVKRKDIISECLSDSTVGTYHIARSIVQKPLLLTDTFPMCYTPGTIKTVEVFAPGDNLTWYLNNSKVLKGSKYTYYPKGIGIDTFKIDQSYTFVDSNVTYSLACIGPSLLFTQRTKANPKIDVYGDSSIQVNSLGVKYTIKAEDPINDKFYFYIKGGNSNNFWTESTNMYFSVDWTKEGIDTIIVEELRWYQCSGYDTLIVKVRPYTYANFTTLSEVKLHPNPTKGNCTIFLGENESETTIVLYDILGMVLQTQKTKNEFIDFDLSGYTAGIYSVSVSNKKGYWLGTVVKE